MLIVGIDQSYSHTAISVNHNGEFTMHAVQSKPGKNPLQRLAWIRDQVTSVVESYEDESRLVFIEDYAFGTKFKREAMGELGGMLKLALYELGWTVVTVAPTALKKFVTGKGNADKDVMMQQVLKRWQYEAPDNNSADAYSLMQMAIAWQEYLRTGVPGRVADTKHFDGLEPMSFAR